MLKQIFEAVLEQLKPLEESGLKVLPFRGELAQPTHRGNLIVGFRRTTSSEPQQANLDAPIIQQRKIELELYLRLLHLQGQADSFDAVGEIENLLSGFKPLADIHCKRFYHVASNFVGVEQGIWAYTLSFAINYPFAKSRSNS